MLACSEPYVKTIAAKINEPAQHQRLMDIVSKRVLFNGKSSFMLSPVDETDENGQHLVDTRDQLVKQVKCSAE